jgi:fluoride ion exporter CrcB/FEX
VKKLLAVALGGAFGSLLRYLTVSRGDEIELFLVNIAGVAIAGMFALRITTNEIMKLALIPGFAGGLTTFSSVAVLHAEQGSFKAIMYFYGTVVASLLVLYALKPKVIR